MNALPTVLVSSVVRSAHQGESHGGLYLLDLATGARRQMVDWNACDIDWSGRGLDRGLRGLAFYNGEVWVAAANELFVFDRDFTLVRSFTNRYLAHCHEISLDGDLLYLSSTGRDSVLEFDLAQERFTRGWAIRGKPASDTQVTLNYFAFDPNADNGPVPGDSIHINNVHAEDGTLTVSALRLPALIRIERGGIRVKAKLPIKTHNARARGDRVLLNNTGQDYVEERKATGELIARHAVPRYPEEQLINGDLPQDHARQAFARGLCVHSRPGGETLIFGSSPATVTAVDRGTGDRLACWPLTMDVRNAVHGLEVWPFEVPELDPAPADAARPIPATDKAAETDAADAKAPGARQCAAQPAATPATS